MSYFWGSKKEKGTGDKRSRARDNASQNGSISGQRFEESPTRDSPSRNAQSSGQLFEEPTPPDSPSRNTQSSDQSFEESPKRNSLTRNTGNSGPRISEQRSPTRIVHHGASASKHHVESMDCDDSYTTSNNVYGSGTGMGYPHQQGNHQYGGYHSSHSSDQWQQPAYQQHHPGNGGGQAQVQGLIFRSAQASKQMVHEVYGNCLAMLEELESRELKRIKESPLPRSDIPLPSQRKHDDDTIRCKLETQLLLFQSQMSSCDKEIKEEVRGELKQSTLAWTSQRESRNLPDGVTDTYAGKLFEVLEKGKTEHPKEFYQPPSIDQENMRNAMGAIVAGSHRRDNMDEDFKINPKKKAKGYKVRDGTGVEHGAERLGRVNPQLAADVEKNGPTSLL